MEGCDEPPQGITRVQILPARCCRCYGQAAVSGHTRPPAAAAGEPWAALGRSSSLLHVCCIDPGARRLERLGAPTGRWSCAAGHHAGCLPGAVQVAQWRSVPHRGKLNQQSVCCCAWMLRMLGLQAVRCAHNEAAFRVHIVQVLHVRVCSTQQSARHLAALLAAAYQLYALQVTSMPECHLG